MNHVANLGGEMCVHVGIHMMKRWRGGAGEVRPPVNKRQKIIGNFWHRIGMCEKAYQNHSVRVGAETEA